MVDILVKKYDFGSDKTKYANLLYDQVKTLIDTSLISSGLMPNLETFRIRIGVAHIVDAQDKNTKTDYL